MENRDEEEAAFDVVKGHVVIAGRGVGRDGEGRSEFARAIDQGPTAYGGGGFPADLNVVARDEFSAGPGHARAGGACLGVDLHGAHGRRGACTDYGRK
jgi:hypothetical protein